MESVAVRCTGSEWTIKIGDQVLGSFAHEEIAVEEALHIARERLDSRVEVIDAQGRVVREFFLGIVNPWRE
jgi:hypothetical protein